MRAHLEATEQRLREAERAVAEANRRADAAEQKARAPQEARAPNAAAGPVDEHVFLRSAAVFVHELDVALYFLDPGYVTRARAAACTSVMSGAASTRCSAISRATAGSTRSSRASCSTTCARWCSRPRAGVPRRCSITRSPCTSCRTPSPPVVAAPHVSSDADEEARAPTIGPPAESAGYAAGLTLLRPTLAQLPTAQADTTAMRPEGHLDHGWAIQVFAMLGGTVVVRFYVGLANPSATQPSFPVAIGPTFGITLIGGCASQL